MRSRPMYYIIKPDHSFEPVDDFTFQDPAERLVAIDNVGDIGISTVFLNIDHRLIGDGEPILFETMVFGGEIDGEMMRYRTWDEAMAGHAAMVERVRAA